MHHQEFEPPQELQDSVKCFWHNIWPEGEYEAGFEVVPDGYAEIIFHFGAALSIAHNGSWLPMPSPFMIGLLNQPLTFRAAGHLEILAVRCFPWTVFDLLGLAPGKDGVRVFEHPIAGLQPMLENLISTGMVNDALLLITQCFENARAHMVACNIVFKAGVAMGKANGNMPVSRVADAAHATVRTLERKFKNSSGYTIKDVSGLMRFEQVRNHLWRYPNANLTALAYELGYSDQAHLSKEFKRYSGSTPAAFTKKAMQGKTDTGDHFVAFIQA